mgnify:FL=1
MSQKSQKKGQKMNFKEAFESDLDEAFFDLDEFAEEIKIDGKKTVAIKQEVNLKDAGNVLKGSFNPRENTQNSTDFTLYIKEKDAKRRFTANALINIDGEPMFVRSVKKLRGMIQITIGKKMN